jgi:low temperature requirement protein LtrA
VFAFCNLAVRLVHMFMFWIVSREDRVLHLHILRFIPSVVVATTLLLLASQTTGTTQTLLWLAALGVTTSARSCPARTGGSRRPSTSPNATG